VSRAQGGTSDAPQWHEMAQHLVQAHGADPDALTGYTPTLEQLRFAHADTHLALAMINAGPPDGHTHPLPMDAGWCDPRESSYRPFPPSAWEREDPLFSDSFALHDHTGLPHTGAYPRSEADLADWAAGRVNRLAAADDAATKSDLITEDAACASAVWLARISFPSQVRAQRSIPPACRDASRARPNLSHPARGRGR
jgi:hypothetical protein